MVRKILSFRFVFNVNAGSLDVKAATLEISMAFFTVNFFSCVYYYINKACGLIGKFSPLWWLTKYFRSVVFICWFSSRIGSMNEQSFVLRHPPPTKFIYIENIFLFLAKIFRMRFIILRTTHIFSFWSYIFFPVILLFYQKAQCSLYRAVISNALSGSLGRKCFRVRN